MKDFERKAEEAQLVAKRVLKKFNKQIKITVEVDRIAEEFLATLKEDHPHKELIVEHVIGTMLHSEAGITPLYNALYGHTMELDFQVDQAVAVPVCHISTYGRNHEVHNNDSYLKATILEVDPFKNNQVKIRYTYLRENLRNETSTTWVDKGLIKAIDDNMEAHLAEIQAAALAAQGGDSDIDA